MRILIADDEPLARERLRHLLDDIGGHEIIAEAGNGREAIELQQHHNADVVLLDIRMPEMDGLEAAAALARLPQPPAVIFTTAYDEHALQAFDADAVDYLVKPIRQSRLEKALTKAAPAHSTSAQTATAAAEEETDAQGARRRICIPQRGGLSLIAVDDILYFHADNKYTAVHHKGGEGLIEESLKTLEQEFGHRFTRIHRNALVANNEIAGLEKAGEGHYRLRLHSSDTRLEVSRRMVSHVREAIAALGEPPA